MTLKNDRAPLRNQFKLCASFRYHLWIQTGVIFRKRPKRTNICFEPCDLDLWPLTLCFCMHIISVNGNYSWKFHDDTMMGILRKRYDWRTDRRVLLLGPSLKKYDIYTIIYYKKMGISILPILHWLSVVAQYVQPWFDKYTDRFGFTNLIILWCQVMCLWWQDSKHGCTIWIHLTITKYGWPWSQYLLSSLNAVLHLYLSYLLYISEQHERRWCVNSCFEM